MKAPSPVILLVEGDIVARHPLAEYLRECGFKVVEAGNGDEAKLALGIEELQVEIVLADLSTASGGFALRQWIREQKLDVDVIMAGSIETAVQHAGEICNEGPALTKPYEHHMVLERIKRGLAERGAR